jgi:Flp pilus assembly pilin Flp
MLECETHSETAVIIGRKNVLFNAENYLSAVVPNGIVKRVGWVKAPRSARKEELLARPLGGTPGPTPTITLRVPETVARRTTIEGQLNRELSPLPEVRTMLRKLNTLLRRDEGNDMIEYALIAAFISIVAIVALQAIGPLVLGIYQDVQAALGG